MKKPVSEFGEYIRNLRLNKRLNGKEVAEKAGISQATISGWEQGTTTPDFKRLVVLMRSLDLKWPETKDFLTSALKTFNGRMAFEINDSILPRNMVIDFLVNYLAADGTEQPTQKKELLKCVDTIKTCLEKLPDHVVVGPKPWLSPLPLAEQKS